jgi:hypothetical protein
MHNSGMKLSKLHCHHTSTDPGSSPEVYFGIELSEGLIRAEYEVFIDRKMNWNTDPGLNADSPSNWGLWNFDVVELFFRKPSDGEYYELQLSPLSQRFQLLVFKPRESYCSPLDLNWQGCSEIIDNCWQAKMEIKWDGPIKFNAHAIVGPANKRAYYSYNAYEGEQPDFHQPKHFSTIRV